MALSTAKVEFSKDDLTVPNASAVWTDISDRVLGIEWWGGKANDLDAPTSGGATIALDNDDRRFEPDYTLSPYYPAIQPGRRFKITITADAADHPQGIYFAESWDVSYDALTTYAQVSVSADDGFGVLSGDTLPLLEPPDANSFEDVAAFDKPFAHYPLNESGGKTLTAITGPEGSYKGQINFGFTSPLLGDNNPGVVFPDNGGYARAALDDSDVFHDSNGVTVEVTISRPGASDVREFAGGPFDTTAGGHSFGINESGVFIYNVGAAIKTAPWSGGTLGTGTFHLALTYDGSTLVGYLNGVADTQAQGSGDIISPDSGGFLYVGGDTPHGLTVDGDHTISQAVFYDYALSAGRISAHALAALSRGYDTQTTGARVASLATSALWSTAGITGGQLINVEPRMQNGQAKLEEINLVAAAEQPSGLFWFDDDGNPAYQGSDYDPTVTATFSDTGGSDTDYTAITPKFDNEYYTQVTIARENGLAQTSDDGSVPQRGYIQTGLILSTDNDADLVRAGVYDLFNTPRIRFSEVSLDGMTTNGRTQILTRDIGDTIRVKVRNDTGEPIDVITRILGKHKTWTPDGNLFCTWQLSRGFDASDAHWKLGMTGYSELGNTTVLA